MLRRSFLAVHKQWEKFPLNSAAGADRALNESLSPLGYTALGLNTRPNSIVQNPTYSQKQEVTCNNFWVLILIKIESSNYTCTFPFRSMLKPHVPSGLWCSPVLFSPSDRDGSRHLAHTGVCRDQTALLLSHLHNFSVSGWITEVFLFLTENLSNRLPSIFKSFVFLGRAQSIFSHP